MAISTFELTLQSAKMVTPNARHLSFKRTDGQLFDFTPGQFITFLFPHPEKVKRRSYSIASIPGKTDEIEIAISHVEGGIATEILFGLKPGDKLTALGPVGRLVLKDEPISRYILVGTGTGIVPYRAMLPEIQERIAKEGIQFDILAGAQYRQDLLYAEDFIEFANNETNCHYHACLSREETLENSHEHKGYVQHQFETLNLDPEKDIVYLCGNPDMIDQAYAYLTENGFNNKNVRREKYISSN